MILLKASQLCLLVCHHCPKLWRPDPCCMLITPSDLGSDPSLWPKWPWYRSLCELSWGSWSSGVPLTVAAPIYSCSNLSSKGPHDQTSLQFHPYSRSNILRLALQSRPRSKPYITGSILSARSFWAWYKWPPDYEWPSELLQIDFSPNAWLARVLT